MLHDIQVQIALGTSTLLHLAKEDYIPAQQYLGFFLIDFRTGEEFLKHYNNRRIDPISLKEGHFGISESDEKLKTARNSISFDEALSRMTIGLGVLRHLITEGYGPAKDFRNNLDGQLKEAIREVGAPLYYPSVESNQICESIFSEYFQARTKPPHSNNKGLLH